MLRRSLAAFVTVLAFAGAPAKADYFAYYPNFTPPVHDITTQPVVVMRPRWVAPGVEAPAVVEIRPVFRTPRYGRIMY